MRIKVGDTPSDLGAIMACMQSIEDTLPTGTMIENRLLFVPVKVLPSGEQVPQSSCPIPRQKGKTASLKQNQGS
jgi:hypothetical protein